MRKIVEKCTDSAVNMGTLAAAMAKVAGQCAAAIEAIGLVGVTVLRFRLQFCTNTRHPRSPEPY